MLKELNVAEMLAYDPILAMISGQLNQLTKMKVEGIIVSETFCKTHAVGVYEPTFYKFNGDSWLKDNGILITSGSLYGVCDDYDQVLKWHREILENPEKEYVITLSKVIKSEEPKEGGWRWHKWGNYIGTKNPKCEYIFDENDTIEEVYCFSIYQILK